MGVHQLKVLLVGHKLVGAIHLDSGHAIKHKVLPVVTVTVTCCIGQPGTSFWVLQVLELLNAVPPKGLDLEHALHSPMDGPELRGVAGAGLEVVAVNSTRVTQHFHKLFLGVKAVVRHAQLEEGSIQEPIDGVLILQQGFQVLAVAVRVFIITVDLAIPVQVLVHGKRKRHSIRHVEVWVVHELINIVHPAKSLIAAKHTTSQKMNAAVGHVGNVEPKISKGLFGKQLLEGGAAPSILH
mmetsp:Transcript_12827/g.20452  ORF Transcript_12827/g.20452 Transcript_12827/m.20452 type:complete len:239 (-) Transcript_12827:1005-1721(-)